LRLKPFGAQRPDEVATKTYEWRDVVRAVEDTCSHTCRYVELCSIAVLIPTRYLLLIYVENGIMKT